MYRVPQVSSIFLYHERLIKVEKNKQPSGAVRSLPCVYIPREWAPPAVQAQVPSVRDSAPFTADNLLTHHMPAEQQAALLLPCAWNVRL